MFLKRPQKVLFENIQLFLVGLCRSKAIDKLSMKNKLSMKSKKNFFLLNISRSLMYQWWLNRFKYYLYLEC
jgi:hypothetical protein